MSENRTNPRRHLQVTMAAIERACNRKPRSASELARLAHTTRGSVHVLLHRMRRYGQIVTLNPGTHDAVHATPALIERSTR